MALTITVLPTGDTQDTEVANLTKDIRRALERRSEVDEVRPATIPAPAGAKVGEALTLGSMLVTVAPIALEGIVQFVRDFLKRPVVPNTKVKLRFGDSAIELEFNPKEITPESLGDLVVRLRGAEGD